jgi:hypothetical protein
MPKVSWRSWFSKQLVNTYAAGVGIVVRHVLVDELLIDSKGEFL